MKVTQNFIYPLGKIPRNIHTNLHMWTLNKLNTDFEELKIPLEFFSIQVSHFTD